MTPDLFARVAAGDPDAQYQAMLSTVQMAIDRTAPVEESLIYAELFGRLAAARDPVGCLRGVAGVMLLSASYWRELGHIQRADDREAEAVDALNSLVTAGDDQAIVNLEAALRVISPEALRLARARELTGAEGVD